VAAARPAKKRGLIRTNITKLNLAEEDGGWRLDSTDVKLLTREQDGLKEGKTDRRFNLKLEGRETQLDPVIGVKLQNSSR
jgi:hypothetical protein